MRIDIFRSVLEGAIINRPKRWFAFLYAEWYGVGLRYVFARPSSKGQPIAVRAWCNPQRIKIPMIAGGNHPITQ